MVSADSVSCGLVACSGDAIRTSKYVVLEARNQTRTRAVGPIPGLPNLGNTCYMNAVLQCLFNSPSNALLGVDTLADYNLVLGNDNLVWAKAILLQRLLTLLDVYSASGSVPLSHDSRVLRDFKLSMASLDRRYAGNEQQDAYRFFGMLLDGLDGVTKCGADGTRGNKIESVDPLHPLCGIESSTVRQCLRCLEFADSEKVADIALGLPTISSEAQFDAARRRDEMGTPISVSELLKRAQRPEEIDGYDCEHCRKKLKTGEAASRSTLTQRAGVLSKTQDIMVVALYRFVNVLDADGSFELKKVRRQVLVPTMLPVETGRYRLYAVVSHCGETLSAGHYVAAVRSQRDQKWYCCSDSVVEPMQDWSPDAVSSFSRIQDGSDPFMLFYQRMSDF